MRTLNSNGNIPILNKPPQKPHKIRICLGSSCFSKGKQSNLEYIEQFLKQHDITESVDFAGHLCIDKCSSGPNIEIDGIMYHEVDPEKLEGILNTVFEKA
ncbi:MAG TPA: (2Fe-2S) ferredoxin domain-containing protein [Bacteroidales bacterium]|nr:(2Fe-2S) ferredoxin domain-containing protein [Bacteroidales bacterium]